MSTVRRAAEGAPNDGSWHTLSMGLSDAIERTLWSEEEIKTKVQQMGTTITRDFDGYDPLVVGILNGCIPFVADLVRAIDLPLEVDYMALSSYGAGVESSGVVRTLKDLNANIAGRHVLVVEDIVDTGLTLHYLIENLATRGPASLTVATLLDKAGARKKPVDVAYSGFMCPDEFVVGYGLDYAGKYRNLPYIGVLKPEMYIGAVDSIS